MTRETGEKSARRRAAPLVFQDEIDVLPVSLGIVPSIVERSSF
jgi:hypothetical protein